MTNLIIYLTYLVTSIISFKYSLMDYIVLHLYFLRFADRQAEVLAMSCAN